MKFKAGDLIKGTNQWMVVSVQNNQYKVFNMGAPFYSCLFTFGAFFLEPHYSKL